jgi:beta-glucosidase
LNSLWVLLISPLLRLLRGKALAQILFGEVNPSGKLPFTIMEKWEDHPAVKTYPGQREIAYYS